MSKVRLFTDLGDTNSSGGSSTVMRINQARAQTDTVSAIFALSSAAPEIDITNLAVTITPNAVDSIITLDLSLCGQWYNLYSPPNAMVSIKRAISDGTTEVIRNANSGSGSAHQGLQPFSDVSGRGGVDTVISTETSMDTCYIHFSDNLGLQTLTSSSTVTYTPVLSAQGFPSSFYLNRTVGLTGTGMHTGETGVSSFHAVDDVLSSS